jgi:hypothetical protein
MEARVESSRSAKIEKFLVGHRLLSANNA